MKVYLVCSGQYSDWHVDAVFLDKAKAHFFATLTDGWGDSRHVIEMENSDDRITTFTSVTYVPVTRSWWTDDDDKDQEDWSSTSEVTDVSIPEDSHTQWEDTYYVRALDDRSEDNYLKIAQDRHAQWKAEQAGIA